MVQKRKWLQGLLAGGCLLLLWSSSGYAGCRVSTTSINFGNYDVFSSAANTSTGSITLSCTPKAEVTVDIEASATSGSFYPRKLHHSGLADTLNYNLYTSATRVQVWGDGNHGTAHLHFSDVKNNNTPPIIVYGMIEPLQNVSTGSYSDQLVITITY